MSSILKTAPAPRDLDIVKAMLWVTETYGKGRFRQFAEIAAMALSPQKMQPKDYYLYGLFRPEIGPEQRKSYVFIRSGRLLNARLSPQHMGSQSNLLHHKVLAGLLLERAGLPVMPILAYHGRDVFARSLTRLEDAAAIAAFLAEPSNLPCFGKPVFGTFGLGVVGVLAAEDEGRVLRLTDGQVVATADLAAEIAALFPQGYIFQPLIRQHPVLEACNGLSVGMMRVVTLRLRDGPRLLYAVQRMPAAETMSDSTSGQPYVAALLDPATGRILRAQSMGKMVTSPATHSPAKGVAINTVVVPHLDRAVSVALDAHRMFPAHGVLGFDIAIREDGPVISEINSNPYHHVYQRPADRGLLHPEFRPMIDEAIAVSAEYAATGRRLGRPGR